MGLFSIGRKRKLLFIGPPRSGKTVFFSTMVDRLIRQAKTDGCSFTCIPDGRHSHQFVQRVIQSLGKQVWPKEGGATDAIGELTYLLTHKGWLFNTQYVLACRDYAGETFNAAYGDPETLECDVDDEQVERLRSEVDSADIVFVIVDAVRLQNGSCPDIEDSLFGVTDALRKKKAWTAFVLTQKDEFEVEDYDAVIAQLIDDYPSLYATLQQMNAEFFWVSSVVATASVDGRRVPPKKYKSEEHSIDLLAPINWALS
ncbi:MAG: hypothetical protein KDB00_30315, partial [Planctomycetales bacterium]|nr:hypothetical protein [Planctomycetales bacterium]